jgi:hypothetical protein
MPETPMTSWLTCRACGFLAGLAAFLLALQPATADDLADFNTAVERAAAHNRVAIGYLRTQNVDLAAVEIDRMKIAWGEFSSEYGTSPPAALRDNRLFTEMLFDVPMRIIAAKMMIDMGRADSAASSLQAIRLGLSKMRRASGIEILPDCVLDYSAGIAAFVAYDDAPPDWSRPDMAAELSARSAAIEKISKQCDALASDTVRAHPEFRRLIDGTLASLAYVPKVVENRDNDLLHRLIGELRAFDNLLVFRYG